MGEFELRDKLKEDRKNIDSFDDLVNFLRYVKDNCNYGYGEAPRAMAQASLAVAWYLANEFGITGFQAGCVMWDFIRDWLYPSNECGMRLIDFDNMLYPQYEDKFQKTINHETFEALQEKAKKLLADREATHPEVIKHWKSIAAGKVPFGYVIKE